jgi:two-component system NtrC family sensor kinase
VADSTSGRIKQVSRPLRWRIVAILLFASLLPLALVGFGSWIVFGNLLELKSLEQMRTVVDSHANAIGSYLSEQLHLLELLAETNSFETLTRPEHLQKLFYDLNRSGGKAFVDLGVIDSEGKHRAYVGPYDLRDKNYRDADWFREVNIRGRYISDVFLGFRQIPHCIIAVQRVENDRSWILRATINSEQFDALVKTGSLGEGSDAYIVNREGFYQTPPRQGSVLDKLPDSAIAYHPGVRDHRVLVEGVAKLRVTRWINDNRWVLVVERDLDAVQAPVNRAIARGAYVVLVAVAFLVMITFFSTRHLAFQIDRVTAEREEMSRAFIRSAKLASIGELTTGLAHEINNPLAIISAEQTNISDLIKDIETVPEIRDQILTSIKRCQAQIQRCAGITRKLLQFGRSQEPRLELTDIPPRLVEIIGLMQRPAGVRNVDIKTDFQPNLPRALLDPVELEQVLVNLINNSLDAMPEGGEILIKAYSVNHNVHIDVTDNGRGIPPDTIERIFEPFFTTKPAGKGTGLGLSICYGIVHSWGGSIEAVSAPGEGTTIGITLPVSKMSKQANR